MVLVIADTSALVSLGTVADHEHSPLDILLAQHEVVLPEQVVSELRETAAHDDRSGAAAAAVLDRLESCTVQGTALEAEFPLDDGENAAVTLANELGATQLLCDEFNRLALIHASLADTRLVTTPTLLIAFVRNGELDGSAAAGLLSEIREARSWGSNRYVVQAAATLRRAGGQSESATHD